MHNKAFPLFRSLINEDLEQFDGLRSEVKQLQVSTTEVIDSLSKIVPNSEENTQIQELRQYAEQLFRACNNTIETIENKEHQEVASTPTPPLWY